MCLILKVLIQCLKYPNSLALICRKHYKKLADSTIKDFESMTGLKVNYKGDCVLPNKSCIMFRHAEQLEGLNNINLSVAAIEQAEEFDDASQWEMIHGRMRRKDCGTPRMFIIANTNGSNWIKRLWKDSKLPGYELHEATTYDNIENVNPNFKETLDSIRITTPSVYQQYVMNSWEVCSGKIFQPWDEKFHVIPDMRFPDWWETFGAMDTAVGSGVVCAIIFKVSPEGHIIAIKEYYDKNKPLSEHVSGIDKIASGHRIASWWADPSCFNKTREHPKLGHLYSVANELEDYGIDVLPAENDVNAGINRVIEHLVIDTEREHPWNKGVQGSPRFFVTESCVNTRREMQSYKESPNKVSERGDRKWQQYKHNDHSVDTIRYGIMSRPSTTVQMPGESAPRWSVARSMMNYQRMLEENDDN